MEIKRTERGWAGHFISVNRCRFRRNTLLELGRVRAVISTVGAMMAVDKSGVDMICRYRYYETMVFRARKVGCYWESNVNKEISFTSKWQIEKFTEKTDKEANDMHEAVVKEISGKIKKGEL